MTFDRNILWRDYDLSLDKGIYGTLILADQKVLMEVKTDGAMLMTNPGQIISVDQFMDRIWGYESEQ